MTVPYTYVLTHTPTVKRYYGVRYANGCHPDELWVGYFSSSKIVRSYPTSEFLAEVRKIFPSVEDAFEWEQTVLRRLKVWKNPNWFNQAIYTKHFACRGPRSEETKEKISKKQKGIPKSKESKEKMSSFWSGRKRKPLSEETKRKIGEKNKLRMAGKKQSEESNKKRSLTLSGKKRKPFTEEHLKNMSLSRKGRKRSPESIEKQKQTLAAKKTSVL